MPREFPEQRDPLTTREGGYADRGDLSPADRALLESATAEAARDPEDRRPGTLADDEDASLDIGTAPVGAAIGADVDPGYGETEDGLDETAEAVRSEAEDRPTGAPDTDYTG